MARGLAAGAPPEGRWQPAVQQQQQQQRVQGPGVHTDWQSGPACCQSGVRSAQRMPTSVKSCFQAWEGRVIRGDPAVAGHMLQATGTRNGVRSSVNFTTDKVVGNGSFGVVYAATCLETGETVSNPVCGQSGSTSFNHVVVKALVASLGMPCAGVCSVNKLWNASPRTIL